MNSSAQTAATVLRGWNVHLALAVLVPLAVLLVLAPDIVQLPSLLSLDVVYGPTGSLAAGIAAIAVLTTTREPLSEVPHLGVRRLSTTRLVRVLALTAFATAVVASPWPQLWLACLGTITALVGEGLALASVTGPSFAWALPTVHLTSALVFGYTNQSTLQPWAWILAIDPNPLQVIASLALLGAGLSLWSRSPARVS